MEWPLIWDASCCRDFPFLLDFNWLCGCATRKEQLAFCFFLTFWTLRLRHNTLIFFFLSRLKLHSPLMSDVTYDNEFYVHRSRAWHTSLSYNDKCWTSFSQIDFFFFYPVISQLKKNSCQCLLFCGRFARSYMPLSAIKQLENKHCVGHREPLVHRQCSSSFLTINI